MKNRQNITVDEIKKIIRNRRTEKAIEKVLKEHNIQFINEHGIHTDKMDIRIDNEDGYIKIYELYMSEEIKIVQMPKPKPLPFC